MLIIWIIIFSLLGSIGSIITASIFLLFKEKIQNTLIPCLISYASGTLLGAALLGMITQAVNRIDAFSVMATVLGGIILFFVLEKFVIWRHCHEPECDIHKSSGPIILIGDAFHNLIDGIVVATGFLVSFPLGITIGLSVIAHEIPQEVGDFGILLNSGYSKKKAFLLNTLSGLSTLFGAIFAYLALDFAQIAIPYVMAVSAASFIYISLADLLPQLHEKRKISASIRQFILICAGIGTIALILYFHP
ncbi:MAG: ZIP family metal transporter [Candidatus Lokiarchaeota archaeon]|nr:ZIP family metal transporter [Candidatus Lokiarchaeota archaeon]